MHQHWETDEIIDSLATSMEYYAAIKKEEAELLALIWKVLMTL